MRLAQEIQKLIDLDDHGIKRKTVDVLKHFLTLCVDLAGDLEVIDSFIFHYLAIGAVTGPAIIFLTGSKLVQISTAEITIHSLSDCERIDLRNGRGSGLTSISINSHSTGQRLRVFEWFLKGSTEEEQTEMRRLATALVSVLH